jgi:hypothetical protein
VAHGRELQGTPDNDASGNGYTGTCAFFCAFGTSCDCDDGNNYSCDCDEGTLNGPARPPAPPPPPPGQYDSLCIGAGLFCAVNYRTTPPTTNSQCDLDGSSSPVCDGGTCLVQCTGGCDCDDGTSCDQCDDNCPTASPPPPPPPHGCTAAEGGTSCDGDCDAGSNGSCDLCDDSCPPPPPPPPYAWGCTAAEGGTSCDQSCDGGTYTSCDCDEGVVAGSFVPSQGTWTHTVYSSSDCSGFSVAT